MDQSKFGAVIEQSHVALLHIVQGNPLSFKELYSREDDATLANPYGGIARGQEQIWERLEAAASHYKDGRTTGFEVLSQHVTQDLACIIEIEQFSARVDDREESSNVSLRTTSVFRLEEGTWRLVHRHADPRVAPQTADSVIRQ
jgi:ketosteroid isomerase-like protein